LIYFINRGEFDLGGALWRSDGSGLTNTIGAANVTRM
jgi:hypothetical protein